MNKNVPEALCSTTDVLKLFFTAAHMVVWNAIMSGDFFHFRHPNLSCPSTDLAEIWHADRILA